ncbi:MAG: hypothetical protein DYH13_09190 [Alphaproteobacteria bacterium PRO2]|nr:hypothetical protein [Alphaproteobacteria bacterium PRO2]
MTFPLWAIFGLGAAILSAGMMLLQERLQVNGYAVAFWNKAACLLIAFPFMIMHGLPESPAFYGLLFVTAVLYAISDVVFFSSIPKTSAGAVSRLIPSASVLGFLIWFIIDPALLQKYLAEPVIFGLIFVTLIFFAFFAFRLKKCVLTMQTLRDIWFVIFAATAGPLLTKLITFYADMEQARYAYVFFQAAMMMALWLVYLVIRNPVPMETFFARSTWQKGLTIGACGAGAVLLKFTSFYYVDNPAYIPAIIALDSVIILGVYKLWGKKAEGDVRSGLGIVACAIALIILKARIH